MFIATGILGKRVPSRPWNSHVVVVVVVTPSAERRIEGVMTEVQEGDAGVVAHSS